ncbi:helix-turn-helix domain-containing protein [Brachybacterium kimchii]|uniref:Helix-turn-helix domain-containing protein n=1 Tax=Brachybacterium kimchii TaxID=2942909 RepID=A0ABY4N4T7_9MICO|nr:helix-turn-helix domain-containing protein [Brachybacterium kimchii]UQN29580.1 helix-turn-helix domain-containing protein [Brachybacterium kimchii]
MTVTYDCESSDGRRCRVTPYDENVHTPGTAHRTWDPYPDPFPAGPFTEVVEYAPAGHEEPIVTKTTTPGRLTEEGVQELPEFLRPRAAADPQPAPETEEMVTEVEEVPRPPEGDTPDLRAFFAFFKAINQGGRPDLSAEEVACLNVMLSYCTHTTLGDCRPGQNLIAQGVGKTERTVRRYIAALIRKRYVVEVQRGSNYGSNHTTEYRLTLPEWEGET